MLSKKTNKLSAKFTIPSQFALNNPQSATHLCALQIGCILRNQINDFCALLLLKKGCREVTHILAHVRVIWNIAAFCCLQFCRSLLLSVRVCNAWLNELFIFLPSSSLLIPFSPADGEVWESACLTLCIWNLMLLFFVSFVRPNLQASHHDEDIWVRRSGIPVAAAREMDVFKAGSTAHHRAT